ncbi:hypothetical protein V6Z11_D07G002100 [Gossypium hirsutum]
MLLEKKVLTTGCSVVRLAIFVGCLLPFQQISSFSCNLQPMRRKGTIERHDYEGPMFDMRIHLRSCAYQCKSLNFEAREDECNYISTVYI